MEPRERQGVLFKNLVDKPVAVTFTGPDLSSDGGVILLKAVDEKIGLTEKMAQALRDPRQPGKVEHEISEMVRERVFGIACGYPDANDAARLGGDAVMKLACENREGTLASQPTLSRFENQVTRTDLLRLAYALTDTVLEREQEKRRPGKVRRITIDMDPTEDPTYGNQQQTFFNAYYDNWCYLPMVTTFQIDEEPEHHLVAPLLRPGNVKGSLGAIPLLRRLVPRLRETFPRAEIFVRMDGAFATPEVFAWLENEDLWYVVNMGKNPVLLRKAEPLMAPIRRQARERMETEKAYGEDRYQAGDWKTERRVIIKAEVTVLEGRDPRDNPRFVITNLRWGPKKVYRYYALRGDVENRIRELKDGLRFDLTSCCAFKANQLRILLVAGAYVLYQELRYAARKTDCARAQVWILRERLIKVGVMIRESVRRILLEGPRAYAWLETWRLVASRVGASP